MKINSLLFISVIGAMPIFSSCIKKCECQQPPQPQAKTLTTQPGPTDGQDCLVVTRSAYAAAVNQNQNANPDINASYWTYYAESMGEGANRAYFRFPALSEIPQNATIKSAKLSLYGFGTGQATANPSGNSTYPGSPYNSYGDNKTWLKRVSGGIWDETTITWNNKPATTDVNQVEIAASTVQWEYNVTDLNVINLVKEMVSSGQNYGFCLQAQVETIYRNMAFQSSESTNAAKRPKLVVEYEIP